MRRSFLKFHRPINHPLRRHRSQPRVLAAESLESRLVLSVGPTAALVALDANCDHWVTPADALTVINALHAQSARGGDTGTPKTALDINGDGKLSPRDALQVINHLNRPGNGRTNLRGGWDNWGSRISDTQKENIRQLFVDLNAIRADSEVTPDQIVQLREDLHSMLNGATAPSEESVAQLRTDFQAAMTDDELSPREKATLASDMQDVLASAQIPVEEFQAVVADLRAIVEASGMTSDDLQLIADDLRVIKEEFINQHPVSEQQQANIQQLVDDLLALRDTSHVSPDQLMQLGEDLRAVADGAQPPDPVTVVTLAHDFRAALDDRKISDAERWLLVEDVTAVLESAGVPAAEIDAVAEDVAGIIEATGVTPEELQAVVDDLFAIGQEFLNNRN
jgi:hypothetical protein